MPDILVRGVPERTVAALKLRAKRNRRSLQQEVLTILEANADQAGARSPSEVAADLRSRLAQRKRAFGDSTKLVRQDRER